MLVSTPQDVALADVIRAKLMFDKVGIPVLGHRREHVGLRLPALPARRPPSSTRAGPATPPRRWASASWARSRSTWPSGEGGDAGRARSCAGAPDSPQARAFLAVARQVAGAVSSPGPEGAAPPGHRRASRGPDGARRPGAMGTGPGRPAEDDPPPEPADRRRPRGRRVRRRRGPQGRAHRRGGALPHRGGGAQGWPGSGSSPRTWSATSVSQATGAKDEVLRVLGQEMRRFLESETFREGDPQVGGEHDRGDPRRDAAQGLRRRAHPAREGEGEAPGQARRRRGRRGVKGALRLLLLLGFAAIGLFFLRAAPQERDAGLRPGRGGRRPGPRGRGARRGGRPAPRRVPVPRRRPAPGRPGREAPGRVLPGRGEGLGRERAGPEERAPHRGLGGRSHRPRHPRSGSRAD